MIGPRQPCLGLVRHMLFATRRKDVSAIGWWIIVRVPNSQITKIRHSTSKYQSTDYTTKLWNKWHQAPETASTTTANNNKNQQHQQQESLDQRALHSREGPVNTVFENQIHLPSPIGECWGATRIGGHSVNDPFHDTL